MMNSRGSMMKVFTVANCILCHQPLVPIGNQPRSPRRLVCGKMMCHECFEREKALENRKRRHICYQNDYLLQNFDYFFMEWISGDSIALSPAKDGYVLCKPFEVPECPICREEYSLEKEERAPFVLFCQHAICLGCYKETRALYEGRDKDKFEWCCRCPLCQKGSLCNDPKGDHNVHLPFVVEFFKELPAMTAQYEETKQSDSRFCGCKKLDYVEEMFYCNDCDAKICGTCVVRKHRVHDLSPLAEKEIIILSEDIYKSSTSEMTNFFEKVPGIDKELIEKATVFQEKLLDKAGNLKKKSHFAAFRESYARCKKMEETFATFTQDLTRQATAFEQWIKEMLVELEDKSG